MPIEAHSSPHKRSWVALGLLAAVNFLVLLDVTIINVALPSIQRDLGAESAALAWLVSGYILTYALGLIPCGRAGDRLGPDRVLLAGLMVFGSASLLCALAPEMAWLQLGRVAQGVGAAMVSPQTMALAHRMFQGKSRTTAFAVFGLVAGLASVMGPLAGGWLVEHDLWGFGWRVIFLINPPLALTLGVLLWRFLPHAEGDPRIRFDLVATVLAALALLLILVPLIEGRQWGWPLWGWAMMIVALPTLAALIWWERRRARFGQSQLLPLSLFEAGEYAWFGIGVGLFFAGLPGFFMILALFLQTGFGFSPWQSGLTAFPLSLGIMVTSMLAPAMRGLSDRLRLVLGAGIALAGLVLLRAAVPGFTGLAQQPIVMACLGLIGLGFGMAVGPLFHLALEPVAAAEAGIASALLQAFQQVGGALGVALTGAVFFSGLDGMTESAFRHALTAGLMVPLACFSTFLVLMLVRWPLARALASR
ncbi:major facilitator superfamily MFS_1 [Thiorhodococcus drewsii AZ1]|uniref:Major facilitator superfamily MFS_1 n=1 Tax=Thiorhodococcus drewsii AZ1 TaxID=765913 RepID=G2E3A2_9GAMM|nr:major facilitator superfamily MFS_1 [Thiorhodococcus drewsii AZ1]